MEDARCNWRYLSPPILSQGEERLGNREREGQRCVQRRVTIARISTRLCIAKPSLSLLSHSLTATTRPRRGWVAGRHQISLIFNHIPPSVYAGILSWRAANPPGRKKEREGGPVEERKREIVRAGLSEFLRIVRASPVAVSRVGAKARIRWGIERMRQKSACHVSAL